MDDLLTRAIARRDELRKELTAIDSFIRNYSEAKPAGTPSRNNQMELWQSARGGRAERVEAVKRAVAAAEDIMIQEGRPFTRTELVARLTAAGHKLEGTDKSKVLGTNLWRSNRFHNIVGAGYWPRSAPIPAEYADLPKR